MVVPDQLMETATAALVAAGLGEETDYIFRICHIAKEKLVLRMNHPHLNKTTLWLLIV